MAGLSEVPTEELLSFQDYPTIHTTHINTNFTEAQLKLDLKEEKANPSLSNFENKPMEQLTDSQDVENSVASKSFWTIEYYQQFFDVDTRDVLDRITYSMFPKKDSTYKHPMRVRPDLYGPFWISVTLVFTIAISGNIAKYFQHVNEQIHWKYNFHLVSYAATAICLYVTIVPTAIWALLKWGINAIDTDEESFEANTPPRMLELICLYGYSLFIYIPVSILWTIQINFLQWILVGVATCLSSSVLLLALSSHIKLSKYKLLLIIGIIAFHLLLAMGFMLYFFHMPDTVVAKPVVHDKLPVISSTIKTIKAV